jgi:hypothetical protein
MGACRYPRTGAPMSRCRQELLEYGPVSSPAKPACGGVPSTVQRLQPKHLARRRGSVA